MTKLEELKAASDYADAAHVAVWAAALAASEAASWDARNASWATDAAWAASDASWAGEHAAARDADAAYEAYQDELKKTKETNK